MQRDIHTHIHSVGYNETIETAIHYTFYNFICLNVSLVILTIKEVGPTDDRSMQSYTVVYFAR